MLMRGEHDIGPNQILFEMVERGKEKVRTQTRGVTSRFRGLQPSFQQTRKSSFTFTLTSKVKGQYFHLECLPKKNGSNSCKEPWTY